MAEPSLDNRHELVDGAFLTGSGDVDRAARFTIDDAGPADRPAAAVAAGAGVGVGDEPARRAVGDGGPGGAVGDGDAFDVVQIQFSHFLPLFRGEQVYYSSFFHFSFMIQAEG
jgi:hypothetical protein